MNMLSGWKQEYRLLSDFIAAHPDIVLTTNEVSIPQALREEFYRRFDDTRRALVEEHFPALPVEIEALCQNYRQTEQELLAGLGLDSIAVPVDLSAFLHNPKEGLTRVVYNKMFDLLQGKISVEEFEAQTAGDLAEAATGLYRLGYERWSALAWIRLLDPDEAFLIDLDEESTPFLRELKTIAFGRQAHHPTMRIPEFLLHSRKLNTYVAVKLPLAQEIDTYVVPFRPPVRPRKRTGDTSSVLDCRTMLLYFLPTPKNIPLVADIFEGNRTSPDWMIEYIGGEERDNPQPLDQVQRHLEAMNPKAGTCLVLVEPLGLGDLGQIPETVYAIAAGFDQSKMQSFVDSRICANRSPDSEVAD